MEVVRTRRGRETSPDRAKVVYMQQPSSRAVVKKSTMFKNVQVVYYLSRNGQLEHPHYMEVTHLANQQLRLKDFTDRLTALRGKGMPSLYSWSCKRSYKNGYVWNDLAENDIIYPSDGAEYVLKGSELVEGCSEKFQQLHVSNNRQLITEPSISIPSKRKQVGPRQPRQLEEMQNNTKYEFHQEYQEEPDEDIEEEDDMQEEYEDEEKTSYTSSTTPHSRCSRGVSTDEIEDQPHKNPTTESTHHDPPPPPPTFSMVLQKPHQNPAAITNTNCKSTSKRFEDGDPVPTESAQGRNSVLLQLISCGNLAMAKANKNVNNVSSLKQQVVRINGNVAKKNSESGNGNNLHREVLYKTAVKVAEEEDMMISFMSENPRFGNLQSEEKEYFSGSIVESMNENRVVHEPGLKRSNSYNEERSSMTELGDEAVKEEIAVEKAAKGKCIPRKKSWSYSKQTKK